MRQYAFPYRREYSGLVGEIYRPVATVYLQSSDGDGSVSRCMLIRVQT